MKLCSGGKKRQSEGSSRARLQIQSHKTRRAFLARLRRRRRLHDCTAHTPYDIHQRHDTTRSFSNRAVTFKAPVGEALASTCPHVTPILSFSFFDAGPTLSPLNASWPLIIICHRSPSGELVLILSLSTRAVVVVLRGLPACLESFLRRHVMREGVVGGFRIGGSRRHLRAFDYLLRHHVVGAVCCVAGGVFARTDRPPSAALACVGGGGRSNARGVPFTALVAATAPAA